MDNIAHALTGAALGEAGLKRLTGLGMPALSLERDRARRRRLGIPGRGKPCLERGWTHGRLAQALLPVLLAGALVAFDRWQARTETRPAWRIEVRWKPLLLLGYVGVLSHLLLDLLNTYGIRLLMS